MTTEEITHMDKEKSLILITGVYPYKATKIKYYEEPYFNKKVDWELPKIIPLRERKNIIEKVEEIQDKSHFDRILNLSKE